MFQHKKWIQYNIALGHETKEKSMKVVWGMSGDDLRFRINLKLSLL